ncbi:response regulator transcription factor [Streptomyces sp. NPDC006459]|uniref:response regulator transcription factor n=1 Tax=Streptomyces sp. NPDC006459 TaxID=3154303 RepID=UPI0033A6650E
MIRVVVVDDEPLIRAGLRGSLRDTPDLDVAAAVPVREAVEAITDAGPRVVLLDACTEDAGRLATGIGSMPQPPSVCVLSRSADKEHIALALAAGASGYVMKDTPPEVLVPLVRFLAAGWTMLSTDASRPVIRHFLADHDRGSVRPRLDGLSPREREVLALLAAGLSNTAIAARLHLGVGTVKDHVSSILGKLDVDSRLQAALLADRAAPASLRPPP